MTLRPLLLLSLLVCCTHGEAQLRDKPAAGKTAENPYKLNLPGKAGDYRLNGAPGKTQDRQPEAAVSPELEKKPYAKEIETAARANNLDPALVHALIHVESRHNAGALSNKGAVGLMQVLPETAQRFGVRNPASAQANLNAGTRYLRNLLDMFDERVDLALAAYNAGEGAVMRYGNHIPPYRETLHYVPAVLEKYEEWRISEHKEIIYLPGTRLDPKAVAGFRTQPAEQGNKPDK